MDKIEDYRQKLEAQLQEWKVKIEILENKAAEASGETKIEMMRLIAELRLKKELVKNKWGELQKEHSATWDTVKDGMENTVSELKSALDKVVSRFK